MAGETFDRTQFRRILTRNVALPLAMSVLIAVVFVGIIAYLVNVLNWVERSERVIGQANEVSKLASDMEAGMRGYLISGDDTFLAPYLQASPRFKAQLDSLGAQVEENRTQRDRLRRIASAHAEWQKFAADMIDRRRSGAEYLAWIKSGRGKILTDEIRREFDEFLEAERRLLQQRNEEARSVTSWSLAGFLLFALVAGGALAIWGRRELIGLYKAYGEVLDHESQHNTELRHLAWLRTGQTELARHSAGIHALEPLAQAILDYVTRYLDGAVAAMYVRSEDGVLRRIGAFGFAHDTAEHAQVIQP
ncbi:MAG TPA: CHASE3 domain-containing protein, partial [Telluria sp.]|nr:CHASE3 domain-containing protein [Telluria sp.]